MKKHRLLATIMLLLLIFIPFLGGSAATVERLTEASTQYAIGDTSAPIPTPTTLPLADGYSINPTSLTTYVGYYTTIEFKINADLQGKEFLWSSSDTDIVMVTPQTTWSDSKATIFGIRTGTAIITMRDRTDLNIIETCTVTVKEIPKPPLWDNWITVIYDPNGGVGGISVSDHLYPNHPSHIVRKPESVKVSRSGYVFVTWNSKVDGSGTNYSPETPTSASVLYAIWKPDGTNGGITVLLNNQLFSFDQLPVMENDRVLVPFRAIFEAFGAEVGWEESTSTVTATTKDTTITLQIGSDQMIVNGKAVTLDVPAQIVGNRTLVPIRAVSEELGANVEWDDVNKTVIITTTE